jgi:hypothetical protein
MKMSKTIALLALPSLILLTFITPYGHAISVNYSWTGMVYSGTDPFYGGTVKAFTQGSTATLNMVISNNDGQYENITGAVAQFDWNGNYTAAGISTTYPIRINQNGQGVVQIQFTVPAATNFVTHSYTIILNYTLQYSPGTVRQRYNFGSGFAVYSSDQAGAISDMQQLGLLTSFGFGTTLCGSLGGSNFKTAQASAQCQKAQQLAALGQQQYATGDFSNAKKTLDSSLNSYNGAITTDSGQGSTDLVATTGTFLLGVGAAIGGIAAILFARRRISLPSK